MVFDGLIVPPIPIPTPTPTFMRLAIWSLLSEKSDSGGEGVATEQEGLISFASSSSFNRVAVRCEAASIKL